MISFHRDKDNTKLPTLLNKLGKKVSSPAQYMEVKYHPYNLLRFLKQIISHITYIFWKNLIYYFKFNNCIRHTLYYIV